MTIHKFQTSALKNTDLSKNTKRAKELARISYHADDETNGTLGHNLRKHQLKKRLTRKRTKSESLS